MNCRSLAKVTVLVGALTVGLAKPGAAGIDFNRDIRPVLSDACFQCHGPDAAKRKAGLRLDTHSGATVARDGVRAIDPARLANSELLARITATDPDTRMPPPEANRQLNPGQVKLLTDWVVAGGEYDRHWAFKNRFVNRCPAWQLTGACGLKTRSIFLSLPGRRRRVSRRRRRRPR